MSEESAKNFNNFISDDEIDFGQILRLILMQSKLIALFIITFTGLSVLSYINTDRIYKFSSLLQVYSDQSRSIGDNLSLDFVLGSSNTSDLTNVNDLYLSRANLVKLIKEKNLNLDFEGLEKNSKEIIDHFEVEKNSPFREFILDLKDDGYTVSTGDEVYGLFQYGKKHINEYFTSNINRPAEAEYGIKLTYTSPENKYRSIRSAFSVSSSLRQNSFYASRGTGLIEISFITKNFEEGAATLNRANENFIKNNIETESETARKAISFIDQRIAVIENELESDKESLKKFRESNNTINVDLEIQSIIQSISEIESKIGEIDIEIAKASNNYTITNPLYQELINQKSELENQRNGIEDKIKNLPVAQQSYIDLFRDLELTQQIYSEFLNKRIEFSIREASTLGNIRVVDSAYYEEIVSPRLSSVVLGFIFSAFFALLFAIFRGLFFLPITNPAELADRKLKNPVIGVVPAVSEKDNESSERFSQSIESLIVNLKTYIKTDSTKAKKILLTSPTEKNGKSFLTRCIASRLATLNHKVLLLDFDLKRGDQHKDLSKSKISLKEFSEITVENLHKYMVSENFFFVPKLTRVSSSFQFFYSEEFQSKMKLFEENFDYIIIDTAPILSVSDTAILMVGSDVNLSVCRHGVTKVNELKQLITISEQVGVKVDGFIYNAYERPSSYYGYYGLYGNYAYQYYAKKYLYESYTYEKDD